MGLGIGEKWQWQWQWQSEELYHREHGEERGAWSEKRRENRNDAKGGLGLEAGLG